MGDYANDQLRWEITHGMRLSTNWKLHKRPRCCCLECGKEVEASEGLRAHIKAKHRSGYCKPPGE